MKTKEVLKNVFGLAAMIFLLYLFAVLIMAY